MGAVLLCLAAASAAAQEKADGQAVAADTALERSLKKLDDLMPPERSAQLQAQQRDWARRRDRECTPTDKPASGSNALAQAAQCRSKMALQRAELLESLQPPARQPPKDGLNCAEAQKGTLACFQQQRASIEYGVHVLYISTALDLPELQAERLHAEQKRWLEEGEQSCRLNGYAHEHEDQAICHFRRGLERVKVYRSDWRPLARAEAKP
ncbi:MAG: lysozyme inhibitor LprI family protein [Comamonas sp.]